MKLTNRPLLLLFGCCRNSRKILFVCSRSILLAGIMVLIAWRFSQAASLTWDGGDATHNGTFGGTGTWDLNTTANWDNGAADIFWTDNSATGVDTAIFSGTAGTVTLNTNVSALGLQFTTTGYTISGTGIVTLGSGGINAGALTTGTTTIGNALSLVGGQSWTLGAGGTLAVSGTITRNVGSTVDFSSAGTFNGAGLVGATSATIANGWATVGGTNWAINDGTNITALTNYASATATTSTAGGTTVANYTGKDVDVTNNNAALGGVVTINSLRFNTNVATPTFTFATGVNTITSGGILVTSAVGNNLSTITGGTLQGAAGKDLVVIQNNTSNGLTIASAIQNNTTATGLTKSGAGTLTLSGANSYTGTTTISAGTLSVGNVTNGQNLGASGAAVSLNGGTLQITNNTAANGTDTNHVITVGANGGTMLLTGNATTGQNSRVILNTTANLLTGSGPLMVTGAAGHTLGGSGASGTTNGGAGALALAVANNYAGAITLQNGGVLEYGIANALGSGATITLGNEGEFAIDNTLTSSNNVTASGGTDSIISFNGTGTLSGTVTLNANATIGLRNWFSYATAANGTISGAISGTGSLTINSGTTTGGTLTLSSATSSYNGGTSITSSTVTAQDGATDNFVKALGTGSVTLNTGSVLNLRANGSGATQTIITGDGTTGNNVIVAGDTTINVDRVSANTGSTFQFNTLNIGANTLTVSGGDTYGLKFAGATTLTGNAIFNATTAPLTLVAIGDGGSGFGLTKLGASTLNLIGTNTFTGATTIGTSGSATSAGTTTVSGASGSIATSSGYTVNGSGSQLNLDYSGGAPAATLSRLSDTGAVTLNLGGELRFTNSTNGTNTSETFGTLALGTGSGIVSVNQGGTGAAVNGITSTGFSRGSNFATGLIRGTNLGLTNNTNRGELKLSSTAGLTFVGASTSAAGNNTGTVKDLRIVPYLIGDSNATGTGTNFVTYDTTSGFRILGSSEQTTLTTGYTTAASDENVNAGTNITLTNASGIAVNSLLFNATSALNSTNSNSLTVDSGAVALVTNNAASIGSGFSSLILGNGEGIFHVMLNTLTVNTPVDVPGGGGLTKSGGGALVLTGANLYTGATTVNQGTLTLGNGTAGTLAANSGAVTVVNGATFALNLASSVTSFANNVSNGGTFNVAINGSQMTLSGNISGAGTGTFSQVATGKTLILSGSNTYSNATTLTGTAILQAVANAGNTTGSTSSALSPNSTISMASGTTLQLRSDNDVTFSNGAITMNSDPTNLQDITSFNFDVNAATAASNKTITLGTVQWATGTSGNRGTDLQTINLTGASGYTLAITNAIGASSNGQSGNSYFYNVASGLTLAMNGGFNGGISTNHTFQGAGNTIVGAINSPAARTTTSIFNQTGTVTLNSASNGAGTYAAQFNAGTTVFNNAAAENNIQINLGNQTASSTSAANVLLGGSTGLNGGLTYTGAVKVFDTTSGLLTLGGQNTSNTNTYSNGVTLGNTTNTGKSVNLVAAAGGTVSFTGVIANNGTDTTAGVTVNSSYTVNGATVNPTGTVNFGNTNTYAGDLTINAGTVTASTGQGTTPTASNLGALQPAANRNITVNNGATFSLLGGNVLGTGGSTNTLANMTLVVNAGGVFQTGLNGSGTGWWNKIGNINLNGGTIHVGSGANTSSFQGLALIGTVTVGGSAASTIDNFAAANSASDAIHLGQNATASQVITFNVADVTSSSAADLTVSAKLMNTSSTQTASGLLKSGAGTMVLSAANAYTGTTTVSGGTLVVSGSLNGTANVSVASPATLASGVTGSIATAAAGNISVSGSLAPGDTGSVGTLTLAPGAGGTLYFLSNSTYTFAISGATSDLVSFSSVGNWLSGSGNVSLTLSGITAADYGNTYTVFHNVSTAGFNFSSITGYDSGNYMANFTQVGSDYQLSFTAIPEPNIAVSLFSGVGLLLFLRRRGKHSRA